MSDHFAWEPAVLAGALRWRGYDVDESAARLGPGGSLTARRERSDRAHLVVVDAAGRFKAEVISIVGDRSSAATVGGLEVRVVETEQVVSVVTALLPGADALPPLLDALERLGASSPTRWSNRSSGAVPHGGPPTEAD